MTSQISGPCCDSDIEPMGKGMGYGKVTFANKVSSSLKRNKIRLGFNNIYPENNQHVLRQR